MLSFWMTAVLLAAQAPAAAQRPITARVPTLAQEPAAARSPLAAQEPADTDDLVELRGVVISAADDAGELANRASVAAAMDHLYDHGFNVVFPVAWKDGVPLWPSVVAETACGIEVDSRFVDPKFRSRNVLTEIVVEAHRAGLEAVPVVDLLPMCAFKNDDKQAPGAKPKMPPGPLDPKAQAFATELLEELVHIHEIDGIAFDARGLATAKLDEKGLAALGDWIESVRTTVGKVDPSIRFVLLDGGTAQAAWMARGLFELAMPRIAARDAKTWKKEIDVLLAQPWCAKDPTRLAPLFVAADGEWSAGKDLVLAAIAADRAAKVNGEVLSSFALLRADEGDIAYELQAGPYYGVALLPWREGVEWRTRTETIPPKAGEGSWEWRTDSSDVLVLQLGGKQKGDASWTLHAHEKGFYDLFVWISPDADVGRRVVYSTSRTAGGLPPRVIDPTLPRNKGWVYVGTVPMNRREEREVLRLLGEETDPTKVTVAGPLVGILSRRPRR